jgi:hypothetical protein
MRVTAGAGTATTATTTPSSSTGGGTDTTVDPDPVSIYDVDAPTALPGGPVAPGPSVIGVLAPKTSDPLEDAVVTAWETMSWTLYSHHDTVDATAGRYQFDCVGATNYFLSVADPAANDALRTAEHIGTGYVPTPLRLADFLGSLPPGGTSTWRPVDQASAIGPGEIIGVPPAPGSTEAGHAMMTAGPAVPLTDGGYAVLVFDSTAEPGHGPGDSRRWDSRDQPLPDVAGKPADRKSGLGYGTVEITTSPTGTPEHVLWSVGGTVYGGQIEVAQPLS